MSELIERPNAYRSYLVDSLVFVKNNYITCFSKNDLLIIENLLQLSINQQSLLSRIILRKNCWIKSSSCSNYIPGVNNSLDIASVVKELIELKIIETISNELNINDMFNALIQTLTNEDLRLLCKSVEIKYDGRKDECLLALLDKSKKQKVFFGKGSLYDRLPALINCILKSNNKYLNEIIRINSMVSGVIKIIFSLIQISSTSDFNAPLLVAFKKIRFPKYECVHTNTLFSSSRRFYQYIEAYKLHDLLAMSLELDELNIIDGIKSANKYQSMLCNKKLNQFSLLLSDCVYNYIDKATVFVENLLNQILNNPVSLYESLSIYTGILLTYCFYCYWMEYNNISMYINKPDYLQKFDASRTLTSVTYEFVNLIEKTKYRYYNLAIHILESLISSNYSQDKRGNWYLRLCVDYNHIDDINSEYYTIKRGLKDSNVQCGQRLSLQKRMKTNSCIDENEIANKISNDPNELLSKFEKLVIENFQFSNTKSNPMTSSDVIDLCDGDDNDKINQAIDFANIKSNNWNCIVCTLMNYSIDKICKVCESPRAISLTDNSNASTVINIDSNDYNNENQSVDNSISNSTQKVIKKKSKKRNKTIESDKLDNTVEDLDMLISNDSSVEEFNKIIEILHINNNTTSKVHTYDELKNNIKEFTVIGQRFGDQLGKSRFFDRHDSLVSVEEYVMLLCHSPDDEHNDDSNINYIEAIDGGGWQGWHCEGSIIRSFYAILLWDVIYTSLPNVFITPYQQIPLDFNYDSFYNSRIDIITNRIDTISKYSNNELINEISRIYRTNYKTQSLVNWNIQLSTYQLVSVCIGSHNLSSICLIFCKYYRQLSSGLPDLLMIRLRSLNNKSKHVNLSDVLGNDWINLNSNQDNKSNKNNDLLDTNIHKKIKIMTDTNSANDIDSTMDIIEDEVESLPSNTPYNNFQYNGNDVELLDDVEYNILLIEVKGPSDKLSDKQILWLNIFQMIGLKSYVGLVREGKKLK